MALPMVPIQIGDIVSLRKQHPCGANRWVIVRTGADVRLMCGGCKRYVLIDRGEFTRRYKAHLHHQDSADDSAQ